MKLIPTWPITVAVLAFGFGAGVYIDHKVMQGRIDTINIAHAEELRLREVKRAADEKAARDRENGWVQKVSEIEQRRIDETDRIRTDADHLVARLRNQAASKPANPSGLPQAAASCETATRGELPQSSREDFVSLAQRADELRSALSACYQAYDSMSR